MIPADAVLHEVRGFAIAASATLSLIFFAETWRRIGSPAVESTRKLVHFGTGAVCLLFPFLFRSHITVLALAASFVALMWGSRRMGFLPSIHAVDRSTEGGIYYPVAVWLTFAIAQATRRMEFYQAAVLVLAIGDAVAALVGKRYGEHRFQVEESRRSFEGSGVFFVATFLIVYLILNLWSDFGKNEAALAALYIAAIVTIIEGISLSGTDNLWIPIATIAILLNVQTKSVSFLGLQIAYLAGIVVFTTAILSRQRKLGFAPRAGLGLLVYSCQAFHGFSWSLPALVAVALVATGRSSSLKLSHPTRVRPVFLCVAPMLGWVLAAQYLDLSDPIAYPAFAATLGGCQAYLWNRARPAGIPLRIGRAALVGLLLAVSHGLFDHGSRWPFDFVSISVASLAVDLLAARSRKRFGDDVHPLVPFTVASSLASLCVWIASRFLS